MAQKIVDIPGIGETTLVKHRASRSLKISLTANGAVRVSLPPWVPYQAAIEFARSRAEWVQENRAIPTVLKQGQRLGKTHYLYFRFKPDATKVTQRTTSEGLWISVPPQLSFTDTAVQNAAHKGAVRILRNEAEALLPERLMRLAETHGFSYKSVQVRQLKARWGSCNSKQEITLNLFLMQLPWHLIDYVLLHELCHTKHLHHGHDFWQTFTDILPNARGLAKEMRAHKPAL